VREALGLLLVVAIGMASDACADFVHPCTILAPKELPDGSSVGGGVADNAILTGATRWGTDPNAVRETVLSTSPQAAGDVHPTSGVLIRHLAAHLQLADDPPILAPAGAPALIWQDVSCRYVVVLDRSFTPAKVIDYAARF
jgi:hypothetical protein